MERVPDYVTKFPFFRAKILLLLLLQTWQSSALEIESFSQRA